MAEEVQTPVEDTLLWQVTVQLRTPHQVKHSMMQHPLTVSAQAVTAIVENSLQASGVVGLEAIVTERIVEPDPQRYTLTDDEVDNGDASMFEPGQEPAPKVAGVSIKVTPRTGDDSASDVPEPPC